MLVPERGSMASCCALGQAPTQRRGTRPEKRTRSAEGTSAGGAGDGGRRQTRHQPAALLERAFESGALAFASPLLEAAALAEVSGRVRSEHAAVYDIERQLGRGGMAVGATIADGRRAVPVTPGT
jgi:hypothetical protein